MHGARQRPRDREKGRERGVGAVTGKGAKNKKAGSAEGKQC